MTTIILLSFLYKRPFSDLIIIAKMAFTPLKKTAVAIFFISSLTYTMIVTSNEQSSAPGMLELVASAIVTPKLPLYSAFIGELQVRAAEELGIMKSWILALQLVGAEVGNMIALPNILVWRFRQQ